MKKRFAAARSLLPSRSDYASLRRTWKGDVVAGVTVGIVALPLALAFGVSSGVGAEAGLITAIVAGLVAAVFGGSNVQVSGPTGAMVVVLAPIVATYGMGAVVTVSVMAGIIVLIAGVLRLGRTVGYIPWPVIEGFTVGIGMIIFLQQVPAALGLNSAEFSTNALVAAGQAIMAADWGASALSILTVVVVAAIMLIIGKLRPTFPASFAAIVIVTAATMLFQLPLQPIGELPSSLPAPTMPDLSLTTMAPLVGPAFAVAALAAIESLLSARVAASLAPTGPVNADRELVGQGLASLAAGFFGGMPATGAIARTAVNLRSGAKTRLASIVHSLALVAVVYLAAGIVSEIPLAALAGVLMVTAGRMVSPSVVRRVTGSSRSSAFVFTITAIITVSFDLITAVLIGILVAAFFALRALSKASDVRRELLPGAVEPGDEKIALFRVAGSLFFGAADRISEKVAEEDDTKVVILALSQLQLLDSTGAHNLAELITTLERRGVTVLLKGIRKEHLQMLTRVGTIETLRHPNHLFDDLDSAIEHARSHMRRFLDAESPGADEPGGTPERQE